MTPRTLLTALLVMCAGCAPPGAASPAPQDALTNALYAWEGEIRSQKIYDGTPAVSGFPDAGAYRYAVEYRVRLIETSKGDLRPVELDYRIDAQLLLNKTSCYEPPHDLRVNGTTRGRLTQDDLQSRLSGFVDRSNEPKMRVFFKGNVETPENLESKPVLHYYDIGVFLTSDDTDLYRGISHQAGSGWTAEEKARPGWFLHGSAHDVLYLRMVSGKLESLEQEEVRGSRSFFGNAGVGYGCGDAHTRQETQWAFRRTRLSASPPPTGPETGGGPGADVVLTDLPQSQTQRLGASAEYRLSVTNNGPAAAIDTRAMVSLPSGLRATSARSTRGTCSLISPVINCDLGILQSKESATISVVIVATESGRWSYSATAMSATADPNLANNGAALTIQAAQ